MDYINNLLLIAIDLPALSYFIIAILAFFESFAFVGLIVPGSVAVIIGGFLASQGILGMGYLFICAALGAILGDSFSFYLGGKGVISFHEKNKIFKPALLEKGESYFKKHGNKSVFFGRFIGWVRPIIPFIAGLFKMDRKTFLFWNILSGLLWAVIHLYIGYLFGSALSVIKVWSTRAGVFIIYLIIAVMLIKIIAQKGKPFFDFLKSILSSIKNAIIANPDIERFVKNHPIVFRFIRRRLDNRKFSGLSLTLLSVAFTYVLFLFFGIVEDIVTSSAIVAADARVANLLFAFRDTELVKIFTWITLLAKWQIIASSAIVISFILWVWKKRIYLVPLWITIIGSELFNYLGKLAFHRTRPDVALYIENTFSFPSGHATMAVAFYGFLTYIFFRQIKKWKYKINALFLGALFILAIGLSRLYLGVHFLSDVLGGYFMGALWLLIGIAISEWLRRFKPLPPFTPIKKTKIVAAALLLAELIFYMNFASHYNPPITHRETADIIVIANALNAFRDKQIPRFTETVTGNKQEPLSFVIVAKDDQSLVGAMQKAGWYHADSPTFVSVAELAKSAILNEDYPTAPMAPSFWNAKVHNLGFEKPTAVKSVRERHHVRFWRTQIETRDGNHIYVGTASQDSGIKWLITHAIKPDIDTERDLLFSDLENAGVVLSFIKEKFVAPTLGKNFSGDQFFTDGKAYFIVLGQAD